MRREIKMPFFCSRFRRPFWAEVPPHWCAPPPSPEFPKILEKNPHKKSLQVARNCAIIQKLEYAGSRGRLHALKRRVTTGRAETSSLTKRGRQGRAGAWDALRSLYVDASNFKSPFGSREHITWRCNQHMARIAGVDLPREKRVEIGLTYIFGIGLATSKQILAETEINPDTRVKDLSENDEQNFVNTSSITSRWRATFAVRCPSTSSVWWRSVAIAACATAATCPSADRTPRTTRVPARAPSAPSRARRRPLVNQTQSMLIQQ